MAGLQNWILSILAAALFLGILEAVTPKGPVRMVGGLAAGMVLFLVILRPALTGLPNWIRTAWEQESTKAGAYSDALEAADETYLETVMSGKCEEYIVSQAGQLGCEVRARVTCTWTEDGLPVPDTVTVWGAMTDAQAKALRETLCAQLGVEADRIVCLEESEPTQEDPVPDPEETS